MEPTFLNLNFFPFYSALVLVSFSLLWTYVSYRVGKKSHKTGFFMICSLSIILTYLLYVNLIDESFLLRGEFDITFEEAITESQWPFLVDIISTNGQEYIHLEVCPGLIQSMMSVIALRSGMPAYVFNVEGKLVDYTLDNNNDPRFQKKWQCYNNWKRISMDTAKSLIKTSSRPLQFQNKLIK